MDCASSCISSSLDCASSWISSSLDCASSCFSSSLDCASSCFSSLSWVVLPCFSVPLKFLFSSSPCTIFAGNSFSSSSSVENSLESHKEKSLTSSRSLIIVSVSSAFSGIPISLFSSYKSLDSPNNGSSSRSADTSSILSFSIFSEFRIFSTISRDCNSWATTLQSKSSIVVVSSLKTVSCNVPPQKFSSSILPSTCCFGASFFLSCVFFFDLPFRLLSPLSGSCCCWFWFLLSIFILML